MNFTATPLEGVWVIEPAVFADDRGFFLESYHKQKFAEHGITEEFVQDNHSFSKKNVVRGLHFQHPPYAQSKLVRVIQGEVFDVAVDIRPHSPTFGKWFGVHLSAENKKILYIPVGFAHGFCVVSETADFTYKCGAPYNQQADGGIFWNDPAIGIEWPVTPDSAILSEKDIQLPKLSELQLQ